MAHTRDNQRRFELSKKQGPVSNICSIAKPHVLDRVVPRISEVAEMGWPLRV